MIPFDQIDRRLDAIGRNRKWLSEASGRKPDSIRVALAPKAPASKRSALLQKALSDAIDREEHRQEHPAIPDRIAIECTAAEHRSWVRAAATAGMDIDSWISKELEIRPPHHAE